MAGSNEMADDTPKPLLNFGEIRPTRTDDAATADSTTVTRVLGGADPAFAPGVPAPNRAGFAGSGVVAAAAHALLLLALVAAPPGRYGGGGVSLDAISVSIVSANAIQAQPASTNLLARAAPEELAKAEGDDTASAKAAVDNPEEDVQPPKREAAPPVDVEKEVASAPTAPEAPAPETVPDAQAAPTIAPTPPEPVVEPNPEPKVAMVDPPPEPPPPEKQEEKPKKEKPTEETSKPSPDAATAGGAPSRGVAPDLPPSAAAAAASRGEARAYGLAVQEALLAADQRQAKARFATARAKGTVVLRLVLADDGALERADIVTSSGHRTLDEIAVRLVRLTTFPRPPPGLDVSERAYLAPIEFK